MLVVSPSGAADPVYVNPAKVHTVIGPVAVEQPEAPGKTKSWHEIRILMDAGVTHTIKYTSASEAAATVARVVNYGTY